VLAGQRHGATVRVLVETYGQDARKPGVPRPLDDTCRISFAKGDMSVCIDHAGSLGRWCLAPCLARGGVPGTSRGARHLACYLDQHDSRHCLGVGQVRRDLAHHPEAAEGTGCNCQNVCDRRDRVHSITRAFNR
jgi:hypothetical protein